MWRSSCGKNCGASEHGATRSWKWWSRQRTHNLPRDFYEVRQAEIHSTLWMREFLGIMWQTNNDFKSQNFTLTNSPLHERFRVGKQDSRLMYALVQISLRRQCYGSKKWEMVNSVVDLKSSCSIQGIAPVPDFWGARREDCISTEQDYPEFLIQENGQSGGTKCSESRPIPSRKTDRLLDLRLLPCHWRPWFRTGLRRPFRYCFSEWQHSGVRY